MQLNLPDEKATGGSVRVGLAAAACALLSMAAAPASAGTVDGSTLVYTEPNRVTAVETVVQAGKEWDDGRAVDLKLAIDALTGASANGAVPSSRIQTFTRPSGQASYSVGAGQTPLDPNFHDTRYAASGVLTRPWGRMSKWNAGINLSSETDYLSAGLTSGISRDFFMRNTTLSAGFSVSHDVVRPMGGAPDPFTAMAAATSGQFGGEHEGEGEGEGGAAGPGKGKNVGDFLVGVTQVLDRATIARVNFSAGFTSGYLTDPYKIVSVVEAPGQASAGDPVQYLYEKRPDRRIKHDVYAEVRRRIGPDVLQASYRYFWDDWSVRSSTVDLHLSQPIGGRTSLEPHYRWYRQTAADFYTPYLVSGRSLPSHASADYRLGAFHARTIGLEGAHTLGSGTILRAGVEYYLQQGDNSPPGFGSLAGVNLFPDVSAWMVRVGATVPIQW